MSKSKKRKGRITQIDSAIFASLFRAKRPIPLRKLARKSAVSWPTAKKHVTKLGEFGIVKTKKSIRRTNVFIDPNLLIKLMKKRVRKI